MFMNKISMSQTWLHNFPKIKSYQIFTTTSRYRSHLAIVQHNSNFATVHIRVTVGGCLMQFEYNFLCQFTCAVTRRILSVYQCSISSYDIATGPHKELLKKKCSSSPIVCFRSYCLPVYQVSKSLSATAALFCSKIQGKMLCIWPCSELL